MRAARVDVTLEEPVLATGADPAQLKVGLTVRLRAQEGAAAGDVDGLWACGTGDAPLFFVPRKTLDGCRVPEGYDVGTIRTLRRQTGGGSVPTMLVLRVTRGEAQRDTGAAGAPEQEAQGQRERPAFLREFAAGDDDEAFRLARAQLDRVSNDPRVRNFLRDPRLQKIIAHIDGCGDDAETALEAAQTQNADFREFTDAILDLVSAT
ncbi:unnamed protein product [Pedinophyceae sp. YPF-701]|nr:unnamed protein product [Pedinophyceae sp. YPF-701]